MAIIGIVGMEVKIDIYSHKQISNVVSYNYLDLFERKGITPIIISPRTDSDNLSELINIIDGLVFIGGEDVSESLYIKKSNSNELPNRDLLEIQLYKKCKEKKIPIFGICRGMQVINVAEGGTLINIESDFPIKHTIDDDGFINHHEFNLNKTSELMKIMKVENYYVCSMHHQKIDKLGKNLKISAKSEDGVIEAIETTDNKQFIIAFQGHIEKCVKNLKKFKDVVNEFLNRVEAYNNEK